MTTADQLDQQVRQSMQAGDLEQAVQLCDQLNARFTEYAPGWFTASQLALRVGKPTFAIEAIDRALSFSPSKPEWMLQRIECVSAVGDKVGALALAQNLAPRQFDNALLASQFGRLLAQLGLHEQALRQYRRAAELQPDTSLHFYNLAALLRFVGDDLKAQEAIDLCIRLNPDNAEAHLLRAELRTQTEGSNNVSALEAAYARCSDFGGGRVRLCYALAKELDDLGTYDRAFDYLAEGSALRRRQISYELANDLDTMRVIRETFGAAQLESSVQGYVNAEPVFVVGMPCTGTTLVQRVLSTHSVVLSVGEQFTFAIELLKHCRKVPGSPPEAAVELLARAPSINFESLGEAYISGARPIADSKAHFVDAMPLNFTYLGMIHAAMPKAKIILLRRDAMDTCFAAFKTLFEGRYPFTFDLKELADYFVAFHQLTDHWLELMPDIIHVVRFEELVTSPRTVIEDLLEYCALSFEEQCVNCFAAYPPAASPASLQLRRAFSQASIGSWRNYEKQLQPVAGILEDAGISID